MTHVALLAMVTEIEEQRNFALRRCAELRALLAESEEIRRIQAEQIATLKAEKSTRVQPADSPWSEP